MRPFNYVCWGEGAGRYKVASCLQSAATCVCLMGGGDQGGR